MKELSDWWNWVSLRIGQTRDTIPFSTTAAVVSRNLAQGIASLSIYFHRAARQGCTVTVLFR
jgi:hypothetical protein